VTVTFKVTVTLLLYEEKKMKRIIFLLTILSVLLSACAGGASQSKAFDINDWDGVLKAAKGQTVNWYMWGGSDSINAYVDNFDGKTLKERYDITLNRVPVADAADYVNQVLSEKEAGVEEGAVDLMWINGENFYTLKQADMLYKDWAQAIPNAKLVNWDNPAINLDFGRPVDNMESPWSSAQIQFVYDSARTSEDELPRSYAELKDWACANPGRFTYIAPGLGGFVGTRFVKGALYEISGDAKQWLSFDQAAWDAQSSALWDYLNELKPCLWRNGETYPKDEPELVTLFANNEVDLSLTQDITGAGRWIADGRMPETARAFVFDNYMIGDFNYVAIPANSPHKAAALVLANLLLEPEFQAAQILPENGFGLGFAIDVTRVTDPEQAALLKDAASKLGASATPAEEMAKSLVGDSAAEYQTLVEEEWLKNVLQK
jgi:putative spermidine/putrescine transport system substrate-binding protein